MILCCRRRRRRYLSRTYAMFKIHFEYERLFDKMKILLFPIGYIHIILLTRI